MRFRTISPALVIVAAVVAGCGSSSGTSSQTTSKAASASPAVSAAAPASAAPAVSTTTAATPSFASGQNCGQLAAVAAQYSQAIAPAASAGHLDLATVVKADQALADATPPAIHSDAELVVGGFAGYLTTLTKIGYTPGTAPSAAQIASISSAAQQFNQPRYQAAMRRISAWVHANCRGL
jgi:hypothetical protein